MIILRNILILLIPISICSQTQAEEIAVNSVKEDELRQILQIIETGIPYLEERLSSEWWQVRYCLLGELSSRNDEHKKLIEKLVLDNNDAVSSQALESYVSNWLKVEKDLIIPRIERLRPIPLGVDFAKEPDVRSVGFHSSMINKKNMDESTNVRSIMFIGIIGKPEDLNILKPFTESQNDYVLIETAKALYRLGDIQSSIKAFLKILDKDVKEHIHYQTEALYFLAELDKNMCIEEYRKIRSKINKTHNDIQPNWLSRHFVQGLELNIN